MRLFKIILLILSIMLFSINTGCSEKPLSFHPLYDIVIENQTSQTLYIFTSQNTNAKEVSPGEILIAKYDSHSSSITVTAEGRDGTIIFTENYTYIEISNNATNYTFRISVSARNK